jgi:hypothetical protein
MANVMFQQLDRSLFDCFRYHRGPTEFRQQEFKLMYVDDIRHVGIGILQEQCPNDSKNYRVHYLSQTTTRNAVGHRLVLMD